MSSKEEFREEVRAFIAKTLGIGLSKVSNERTLNPFRPDFLDSVKLLNALEEEYGALPIDYSSAMTFGEILDSVERYVLA